MEDFVGRRADILRNIPAELAIRNAIVAVEVLPADARLTDVVTRLDECRNLLADWVEQSGYIKPDPA